MRSQRQDGGFTLIEVMVTIGLMALLAIIAVPSFNDAALGSQLRATASDLAASALLARSEAIKRNAVVTLCASSDGLNCTGGGWEQGWLVTSGTVLQRQLAAPSGLLVSAGGTAALMFQPIGAGATSATFTVCRATPTVGREARVVTIDPTGRPWIKTTNPTTCP